MEGGRAGGVNYGQMMVKLMMMFLKLLSNIVILFYPRMLRSDVRRELPVLNIHLKGSRSPFQKAVDQGSGREARLLLAVDIGPPAPWHLISEIF